MNNLSVQWHITERCPNHCKHCYMDEIRSLHNLSFDNFKIIFNKLKEFESSLGFDFHLFSITGGDPMSNPDWEKIVKVLRDHEKEIRILGIPEQVTPMNIKTLRELGINSFQISLDGMENIHDYIRGNGSFKKSIEAIHLLVENDIRAVIMYTVNNKNAEDLFCVIDFLDSLNLPILFAFDFMVMAGSALDNLESISCDYAKDILKRYLYKKDSLIKKSSKLILSEKSNYFFPTKHWEIENIKEVHNNCTICSGCSVGWNTITIMPSGEVYPCRRMPISVGNLFDISFADIYINNPVMKQFRRRASYSKCGTCKFYKYCRGCPAIEYGLSGNPFNAQEFCSYYSEAKTLPSEPSINCSFKEELEFISCNLKNLISKENLNNTIDITKSLLLLSDIKERHYFMQDPIRWSNDKGYNLNPDELDFLLLRSLEF